MKGAAASIIRRVVIVSTIGAAALLLTACSQSSLDPTKHLDVRAKLDSATQQIELPLDKYLMSDADAPDRTCERCSRRQMHGGVRLRHPAADGDWDAIKPTTERPYGLWSVESAARYRIRATAELSVGWDQRVRGVHDP